jgi:hypothetical protein
MIRIIEMRQGYLLITDGNLYGVIERRCGHCFGLHNGPRRARPFDDAGMARILGEEGSTSEAEARHRLDEVADEWADLMEHLR